MSEVEITTATGTWRVNTHLKNIIGRGAYGLIYKGTNNKDETIAAKTINGADHRKIFNQDLEKLLTLDHTNVVKIFDINQQDNTFWMFMEYCNEGDLNKFFRTKDLPFNDTLDVMRQISTGLVYLHEHNVIHRDIKPGNILVDLHREQFTVKLTDFDLSKFLDPDIETSVMSSNVGTLAFKAPEFFQRNHEGKLNYHRNVDVYALGLTFLAMVQMNKPLVPKIETPQDDAELHNPIGSTIANRIKFQAGPLDVVTILDGTKNPNKRLKGNYTFKRLNELCE